MFASGPTIEFGVQARPNCARSGTLPPFLTLPYLLVANLSEVRPGLKSGSSMSVSAPFATGLTVVVAFGPFFSLAQSDPRRPTLTASRTALLPLIGPLERIILELLPPRTLTPTLPEFPKCLLSIRLSFSPLTTLASEQFLCLPTLLVATALIHLTRRVVDLFTGQISFPILRPRIFPSVNIPLNAASLLGEIPPTGIKQFGRI